MKNRSSVTSATIQAIVHVIWKCTNAITLENIPTFVLIAISQANNWPIFSGTWWKSTERNQISKNKPSLFPFLIIVLKFSIWTTLEKSPISVVGVAIPANNHSAFSNIWKGSTEGEGDQICEYKLSVSLLWHYHAVCVKQCILRCRTNKQSQKKQKLSGQQGFCRKNFPDIALEFPNSRQMRLKDFKHNNGPNMLHRLHLLGKLFVLKHFIDFFDWNAKFNTSLLKSSGNFPDYPDIL